MPKIRQCLPILRHHLIRDVRVEDLPEAHTSTASITLCASLSRAGGFLNDGYGSFRPLHQLRGFEMSRRPNRMRTILSTSIPFAKTTTPDALHQFDWQQHHLAWPGLKAEFLMPTLAQSVSPDPQKSLSCPGESGVGFRTSEHVSFLSRPNDA